MKFIEKLIRSLLGRGVLSATQDEPMLRTINAEFLPGDVREEIEHFEPYGWGSRSHPGAEVFAAFFNGDRSHGVALVVADRRYRLKLEEGEVAIFDDIGQKVHLTRDGIKVVTPKNLVGEVGGTANVTVAGSATLKASSVTIDAPTTHFTGSVTAAGDITAGTISLQQHVHVGVQSGPSNTGKPQ